MKARTHGHKPPLSVCCSAIANALAKLVEHFRGLERGQRRAAASHGYLVLITFTVYEPETQFASWFQGNADAELESGRRS